MKASTGVSVLTTKGEIPKSWPMGVHVTGPLATCGLPTLFRLPLLCLPSVKMILGTLKINF